MPVPLTNLPVRIGVCLVAEDLYGSATGLRGCVEIMRTLDFRDTMFRLSFVRHANDILFEGEPIADVEGLNHFARVLSFIADPVTWSSALRIAQKLAQSNDFHGFSDQALAAAIELAGAYCLRTGGTAFEDPRNLEGLARVVFSLQGATFSPQFTRMAAAVPSWDTIPEKYLAEVIRNHLAHNALGSPGNAVARLYAMATEPRIAAYFQQRTGESLDAWFQRRLGMTAVEYLRASYLVGASAARYEQAKTQLGNLGIIETAFLENPGTEDREHVRYLLSLAKLPAEAVGRGRSIDSGLCDYLYGSFALRVRPFVDMTECVLPTTFNGVLEKFMLGLPHLFDEAARVTESNPDIGLVRTKFGHIFERYLGVLLEDWIGARTDTRLLLGYRVAADTTEWDAVVFHGNTAFCFEAKAKVFVMGMRTDGGFETLDQMLLKPIKDAYLGAQKLLEAAQQTGAPSQLAGITQVVPILVVFDRVPLRFPYLDRYERHVEEKLGSPIFHPTSNSILPLQTFEIEGVESWEEFIDMGPTSTALFEYLKQRPLDQLTRHDRKYPLARPTEWRTPNGPLRRFFDQSATMFKELAKRITASSGKPTSESGST